MCRIWIWHKYNLTSKGVIFNQMHKTCQLKFIVWDNFLMQKFGIIFWCNCVANRAVEFVLLYYTTNRLWAKWDRTFCYILFIFVKINNAICRYRHKNVWACLFWIWIISKEPWKNVGIIFLIIKKILPKKDIYTYLIVCCKMQL